ncbi:molecular chaperone [Novosphingobium sp.]|uniref:molecular chaperone n=1 Tax=Novosphingobium sp. TaxID=1874826 RepID=UPI0022BED405|nr:molecular chaperone [Novosphingobium sp.]MCZ8018937.1 molecular chaperone [Novosphingobium sp.]MCZ8034543.1 molecular chaperone [Novosphingobium sp.]MCZ8052091.1 molecular chaperone [Novosphingobium sp.]MCZ8060017.1 molecular chaperone [Novosphingobium sp.]MCZ8230979.1 molecular chaperone [Novosphingobium sp.]
MTFTNSLNRLALGLGTIVAAALATPASAQGDLLVAPTRVVLNGGGNAEVVLSNIGSQPATYRIGVELRRMEADGNFADVTEAEANATEKAALEMLRYAPRRITLLPGQPQSIRLSARPAPELPDGEYRVHMSFRAVPPALSPEAAQEQAAAGQLSIRLTPVYGITIPVFIRKGRLEAGATIANPRLVRTATNTVLELDMRRTGQRSVYGEILGKRGSEQVFQIKGVAIYPEVEGRTVKIPLSADQLGKLKGPVRIEYREMPENGGQLIAEVTSAIQ